MYVELCCRSNFSFLRGASDSRDYVRRAHEHGMNAIGISDINGVYGLPRAYEAVRANPEIEMKLICGAELTVQNHPSIHLIVKTRQGWGLLCRLITQLHAGKLKGEGFITKDEIETLFRFHAGKNDLICIAKPDEKNDFLFLKKIFKENLYISLCRYLDGLDAKRTQKAKALCYKFNLSLVATNDVHYDHPAKRTLQDCLACIREGVTLDTAGFKLFGNSERHLKSPSAMKKLFADLPEAIANTVHIANSCTFCLSQLKYSYPKEAVPEGHTARSYLEELVFKGALERNKGKPIDDKMKDQIHKEIEFFAKRKEEDYFLTMYDILRDAREKKIVFQGRGSAASSVVCYCLGITSIDPVKEKLLFDRFANDARPDPPDIDVDFEHERREEVIQGIYDRYGREHAGMVAAVHTYQDRGSYREICKALGVAVGTLKADVVRARFEELAGQHAQRGIFVEPLQEAIAGFPRHIGTHSGGFVITNELLAETVPIEPAAMDGRTIVQFDKHDLETLQMMKIDILSIGFLTVIRKTCEITGTNWQDIPLDDKKTYELVQKAETAGCFQIESRAQMNSLPHTQPANLYEMTIQVALIRPSMSIGGMARSYLRGRANTKRGIIFKSGNAAMDRILTRTHGVAMFPEQIMQIAMEVCGFSSARADELRRALGRERSADTVDSQGQKLYDALVKAGISEKLASDTMTRTKGFASYGFPEAHAASYGSLAFKSAFLKAHHPAEFLCAMINSQPMGFYHIDFLINEAVRNSQVTVLPIHAQLSQWDATMVDRDKRILRMGFRNVRTIRREDVDLMVEERKKKPFDSIEDFIARTSFSKEVLKNLTIANAFECFGIDRRHSFWRSLAFRNLLGEKLAQNQYSFFDEGFELTPDPTVFEDMTNLEKAVVDYRNLGYSLQGSLMKNLRLEFPHLPPTHSQLIKNLKRNDTVLCAGILLVDQRPPPAKGFGFITLEDEYGTIDLVLPPQVYDDYKSIFRSSRFLIVSGKVQRLDNHVTIKVDHVESFAVRDKVRSHQPSPRMLDRLDW